MQEFRDGLLKDMISDSYGGTMDAFFFFFFLGGGGVF